jgi:hypothetical protein
MEQKGTERNTQKSFFALQANGGVYATECNELQHLKWVPWCEPTWEIGSRDRDWIAVARRTLFLAHASKLHSKLTVPNGIRDRIVVFLWAICYSKPHHFSH